MNGFVQGIYRICDSLQSPAVALLILMLLITGITTMIDGFEAQGKMKQTIKWILIGAAVAFTATTLGKEISGWFM